MSNNILPSNGQNKQLLALDPGNGNIKAQLGNQRQTFSSLYGRTDDDVTDILAGIGGKKTKAQKPFEIDLGNLGRYDIGLEDANGFNERLMGTNRYTDKVWAKLIAAASFSRFPKLMKSEGPIILGLCAPYAYLRGIGNNTIDIESELNKNFRGTHKFDYGGKSRAIKVSSVKVFGEGLCGYYFYALDKDLNIKPEYTETTTVVLDIGRGTINILAIAGHQILEKLTRAEMWGVDLLYQSIAKALDNSAGYVSPELVEAAIRNSFTLKGHPNFKVISKPIISDYVSRIVKIAQAVEARVEGGVDRIMVMGGGAQVLNGILETALKDHFKQIVVGDEFTNVRGLFMIMGGIDEWEDEESHQTN